MGFDDAALIYALLEVLPTPLQESGLRGMDPLNSMARHNVLGFAQVLQVRRHVSFKASSIRRP
ncbi:MAG: hypothetical protein ACXWCP_03215 [Burkholderiales bacterium]